MQNLDDMKFNGIFVFCFETINNYCFVDFDYVIASCLAMTCGWEDWIDFDCGHEQDARASVRLTADFVVFGTSFFHNLVSVQL